MEGTTCEACPLCARRGGHSIQDSEEIVAFGRGLVGEAEAREGGETEGPKLRGEIEISIVLCWWPIIYPK